MEANLIVRVIDGQIIRSYVNVYTPTEAYRQEKGTIIFDRDFTGTVTSFTLEETIVNSSDSFTNSFGELEPIQTRTYEDGTATSTIISEDCPPDSDNDGIIDSEDNCPNAYNPNQTDLDGDGIGNACDTDNTTGGSGNETGDPNNNDDTGSGTSGDGSGSGTGGGGGHGTDCHEVEIAIGCCDKGFCTPHPPLFNGGSWCSGNNATTLECGSINFTSGSNDPASFNSTNTDPCPNDDVIIISIAEATYDLMEDQIDDSELMECHKVILDELKNTPNARISELLKDFAEEGVNEGEQIHSVGFNAIIKTGSLTSATNGETDFSGFNHKAIITLNWNNISYSTDLLVATTIMHEFIHAWLGYHFTDPNNPVDKTYQEYYNDYINQVATANNIGHDVIADVFRNHMANALKSYAQSKGYDTSNNAVFQALAWSGLTNGGIDSNGNQLDHPRFIEYVPDAQQRQIIKDIIFTEENNDGAGNGQNPTGQRACN